MSPGELRTRLAQALWRHSDAWYFQLRPRPVPAAHAGTVAPSGKFFFEPSEVPAIVAAVRREVPGAVDATLAQAERVLRHRFDLLGYKELDFGRRIDWQFDPVSGTRAAKKPWPSIQFLSYEEAGDAKVIWELNRHQHLALLARAYWYSGEARFAHEVVAQWYDWCRQNPYPIGINWASTLEVAFRSLSWIWVWRLLGGCEMMPAEFWGDLHAELLFNGRYIERYLSRYFSPNTHLLGEYVALFFLGATCQGRAAQRWLARGWHGIVECAARQVRADGLYFEQSTYYHLYALDFFLHARTLAVMNGLPIPPDFNETVQQMASTTIALASGGPPARFGDDDGGRVFDGSRNRPEHFLDPLPIAAAIYGDRACKSATAAITEEMIWLLGSSGLQRFHSLQACAPHTRDVALRESGIYVMRSLVPGKQQRAIFDAGPQGAYAAGHGHADSLSLQLCVGGREVLCDPGTYLYVGSEDTRRRFRGTRMHNTLVVDGRDQADATGPFPWSNLPEVSVEGWSTAAEAAYVAAQHTGFLRLSDPVLHRRAIFFRRGEYCLIFDRAECRGPHQFEVSWHCAAGVACDWRTTHACVSAGDPLLWIVPESENRWTAEMTEDWYSPAYGARVQSSTLRMSCRQTGTASLATLLQAAGAQRGTPSLRRIERKDATAFHIQPGEVDDFAVFANTAGPYTIGEIETNAEFLHLRKSRHGEFHVFAAGVSFLSVGGRALLRSRERSVQWEATTDRNASQGSSGTDADEIGARLAVELLSCVDATPGR